MQQPMCRFHLVLIYVGVTLLIPLLLPIPYALYDLLMAQLVSVVWPDLHSTIYLLLKMLFTYGVSAALVTLFMTKLSIAKRLQPQYFNVKLWSVGCILALVGLGSNLLVATGVTTHWIQDPDNKQLIALILFAAKIILLVAIVCMLIGVSPKTNK